MNRVLYVLRCLFMGIPLAMLMILMAITAYITEKSKLK